jgi:hypothetical protein
MNLPDDFIFSQSSLQDYVDCPRRFQLKYLLKQRWPAPEVDDMLEFERRMEQGDAFHHLVHQHLVGIPAETLAARQTDADVQRWFAAYRQTALQDVPAKFDLLAVEPGGRALILDWKTGQHIPRTETLERRLQTVVYRYVLAAGGSPFNGGQPIPPDRIEMIYWYAEHDGATRRFPYNAAQFKADHEYLLQLVNDINTRPDFPLTNDESRCRFCVYRSLNNRGDKAGSITEWDADSELAADLDSFSLDLSQIAEIEF